MARNDPDSSVSPNWRLDVLVLDLHEGEGRGGGGTMEAGQAIWYHLVDSINEIAFRWNHRIALGVDDTERTLAAIKGAEGKRLTYRRTDYYA